MLIHSFIIRKEDEARRQSAVEFLRVLKLNREMQVDVKEYKRNRSTAQNSLLWSWYSIICRDTGQDPEDLHEDMKARVLGCDKKMLDVLGDDGIIRPVLCAVPRSTKKINVAEMTRFLEAVEVLAAILDITLSRPDIYDVAFGRKPA